MINGNVLSIGPMQRQWWADHHSHLEILILLISWIGKGNFNIVLVFLQLTLAKPWIFEQIVVLAFIKASSMKLIRICPNYKKLMWNLAKKSLLDKDVDVRKLHNICLFGNFLWISTSLLKNVLYLVCYFLQTILACLVLVFV